MSSVTNQKRSLVAPDGPSKLLNVVVEEINLF
jgi:hypothetical protein